MSSHANGRLILEATGQGPCAETLRSGNAQLKICTMIERKQRPNLSGGDRVPTDAACHSRVDTALPLILHILILHIPSISSLVLLEDISSTASQPQVIRRDEILALWRRPLAGLPGLDFQQEHGIDFFQRAASSFRQEKEDDQHGNEVEASEEVAVGEADVTYDEGGGEADEEVEGLKTLACCVQGRSTSTLTQFDAAHSAIQVLLYLLG